VDLWPVWSGTKAIRRFLPAVERIIRLKWLVIFEHSAGEVLKKTFTTISWSFLRHNTLS
jgi:hypothetical protein